MSAFLAIFSTPPDSSQPLPLSNKPSTIYGATLPFHIIAWLAVGFRLYTRLKVVREPGWDDYLIIPAAAFNLVALVAFYLCFSFGLGKHLFYVDFNNFSSLLKCLYVQHASYYTCTGLVKLSLLFQFLRVFKKGGLRWSCIVLLGATIIFTLFWFIQGWFPCFPVSGFWNRTGQSKAKCWGTGFADNIEESMIAFIGFAGSNMALDAAIFFVPMVVYFKPSLGARQILALTALFSLGSIVLLMSILRLWMALRRKNDPTALDFTWWYPGVMIFASLEVDFAIISASIPIFWPVIVDSLPQIFITQEVRVTHHQRLPDGGNMEYELEMMKNHGGDSQENLTEIEEHAKTDYNDQFVVDHVTGKIKNDIEIVGQKHKKKWGSR